VLLTFTSVGCRWPTVALSAYPSPPWETLVGALVCGSGRSGAVVDGMSFAQTVLEHG